MGLSEELSRLSELHDRGELTDAEFESAKARLLAASSEPPTPPAVPSSAGRPYGGPGYGYAVGPPPFPKPPTNMLSAVLATLLCCLPIGVVALVYASQVDSKWSAGDWAGAREASRNARNWSNLALAAAVVVGVLYFAVYLSQDSSGY